GGHRAAARPRLELAASRRCVGCSPAPGGGRMSRASTRSRRWCDARGQASVEVVASAGFLLLAGLIGFQLLGFGYAVVMADNAAEAAALALVNGRDPAAAAREALPAWPAGAVRVRAEGGRVAVTLFPPSPLRLLRQR